MIHFFNSFSVVIHGQWTETFDPPEFMYHCTSSLTSHQLFVEEIDNWIGWTNVDDSFISFTFWNVPVTLIQDEDTFFLLSKQIRSDPKSLVRLQKPMQFEALDSLMQSFLYEKAVSSVWHGLLASEKTSLFPQSYCKEVYYTNFLNNSWFEKCLLRLKIL